MNNLFLFISLAKEVTGTMLYKDEDSCGSHWLELEGWLGVAVPSPVGGQEHWNPTYASPAS